MRTVISMPVHEPCSAAGQQIGPALLEHLDALYKYALALTRSRTDAEDLVQETSVRALRAAAQLRPDSHLKSWLFTILRNLFLNDRRGQGRSAMLEIDADQTPESAWNDKRADDPEIVLLRKIERQQMIAALECLPLPHREMLVLREFEELSYEEIARILGCPVGTVMSRLSRARRKLKEILESMMIKRQKAC